MNIIIVVDHLRMGGAERVALDQAYQLSDDGHIVYLAQFSGIANSSNPNYLTSEFNEISERGIELFDFSGNHLHQLSSSIKMLRKFKPKLLIVHSLRGAVVLKVAKSLIRARVPMTVSIHQLPELSAPVQRYRRFIYAQFADRLFACSFSMQEQWTQRTNRHSFGKYFLKKEIELLRNGVYLGRLGSGPKNDLSATIAVDKPSQLRVISLGRNVAWKRLDILINCFELVHGSNARLLIMRPGKNQELEDVLNLKFSGSVEFVYGKTVSDLSRLPGDVHLYPTDSGRHSQSSINIIEMACLGIPSLVSLGGGQCWPELVQMGLIVEVDWNDTASVHHAMVTAATTKFEKRLEEIRKILSIEKNVLGHLNSVKDLMCY